MPLPGTQLAIWIGSNTAAPIPPVLAQAVERVEVTQGDTGRSGFRITFHAGRAGVPGLLDDPVIRHSLLQPFYRVVLILTVQASPRVLMDGVITHLELDPSAEPGESTFSVTGEDLCALMDLEERAQAHPGLDDAGMVRKTLARYLRYGIRPAVSQPRAWNTDSPAQRTPVQRATDLDFILQRARRNGYIFQLVPGPLPLTNEAYWGPPHVPGLTHRALSLNLGAHSNVDRLDFQYDALAPLAIAGRMQDLRSGKTAPLQVLHSSGSSVASRPASRSQSKSRQKLFEDTAHSMGQALSRTKARVNEAEAQTVQARGELDGTRYGDVLRPRSLVGVRGAGWTHDGDYRVRSVTHTLRRGEYRQSFLLSREGTGAKRSRVSL